MAAFSYYVQRYWLPFVLVIGIAAAAALIYKNWDRIVIKGSGRK
ncbi:MAG: hypothetical protein K0S39_941 [Paenibacillus sp.]|jgi:hypothetical protein|nr:hypothetical protein [Paenibacillus sp.]